MVIMSLRNEHKSEPPKEIKVIGYRAFKDILASQKYSSFNGGLDGLCVGIAEMGVSEFLAGNFQKFVQRLQDFADLSVEEFLKKKKMFFENDAKAFPADERKKFANLLALLDGIELYVNPMAHREIFNRYIHQFQSPEVHPFVESQELTAKGGRVEVDLVYGVYYKKELEVWLTTLHNILMQQPKRINLGVTFFKKGHTFSLCFLAETGGWTFIDSEALEYVAHSFKYTDLVKIVCEVMRNFNGDKVMGFVARIVTTADQKHIADKVVSTWHKQIAEIEEITVEKANRVSNYGESLVHLAAMVNDSKTIQLLADKKTDLNKLNNGESAVFDATFWGSTDALRALGKNGADLGMFNEKGATPLMAAALLGHSELVPVFAENNPKLLNQQNKGQQITALHLASAQGHDEFVRKLIKSGAEINLQACDGSTALDTAVNLGKLSTVKILLEEKADVSLKNNLEYTLVHFAVASKQIDVLRLVLEEKIDVNAVDKNNVTAVMLSAITDFPEAIDLLAREYKADVNIKGKSNSSPLYIAAQLGKTNVVRALLNNKANLQCNIEGSVSILLEEAKRIHRTDQVNALFKLKGKGNIPDKIADFSPLHAAAFFGHDAIVRDLVKADASLVQNKTFGITAFEFAHAMGHKQIARFLAQQAMLQKDPEIKIAPNEQKLRIYKDFSAELSKLVNQGVSVNKSSLLLYAKDTSMTFLSRSKLRKKQAGFLCGLLTNCYKKIDLATQRQPVDYLSIDFEINHLNQMMGNSIADKRGLRYQYDTYSKSTMENDELGMFIRAISSLQEKLKKDLERGHLIECKENLNVSCFNYSPKP